MHVLVGDWRWRSNRTAVDIDGGTQFWPDVGQDRSRFGRERKIHIFDHEIMPDSEQCDYVRTSEFCIVVENEEVHSRVKFAGIVCNLIVGIEFGNEDVLY